GWSSAASASSSVCLRRATRSRRRRSASASTRSLSRPLMPRHHSRPEPPGDLRGRMARGKLAGLLQESVAKLRRYPIRPPDMRRDQEYKCLQVNHLSITSKTECGWHDGCKEGPGGEDASQREGEGNGGETENPGARRRGGGHRPALRVARPAHDPAGRF